MVMHKQQEREGIGLVCCQCFFYCFFLLFALAFTTGIIFLDFWVGWVVQLNSFTETGNALAKGYPILFVIPAETDPWSIFSCFLYGFLIVKVVLVVICILLWCCCVSCIGCFGKKNAASRDDEFEPLCDKKHPSFL